MSHVIHGLASPTLALLYLAQGHADRARETLDEVLANQPDNGHALALRARIERPDPCELRVRRVAGAVAVHWRAPSPTDDLHVVVAISTAAGDGLRYTSIRCDDCSRPGEATVPTPDSGALSACLVRWRPGQPFRPLAVVEPLVW